MRHPDGTYDLTIDDIHEIREKNYEETKNMSDKELIEYYKNKADEISKKYNLN
jgi:hypothetical protein